MNGYLLRLAGRLYELSTAPSLCGQLHREAKQLIAPQGRGSDCSMGSFVRVSRPLEARAGIGQSRGQPSIGDLAPP